MLAAVQRNHLKRLFIGNAEVYATQEPDKWAPHRTPFNDALLDRHLRGEITLGTYLVREDEAKLLAWDIDEDDDAMLVGIKRNLYMLGVHSRHIGVTTTGGKGWHIFLPLAAWAPASDVRRLALAVAAGVPGRMDVFPRQATARDLGNLIRLPFGKHQETGRRAEFLSPIPLALPLPKFERIMEDIPEVMGQGSGKPPAPFHCMEAAQEGPGEGQRNTLLTHLATMLRRQGLAEEHVETVVHASNAYSDDPLEGTEVTALLKSSKTSGPLCRQLEGTEAHCGDDCILARRQGLWNRPGDIKSGVKGEKVVVQIGERTNKTVYLEHPDGIGMVVLPEEADEQQRDS